MANPQVWTIGYGREREEAGSYSSISFALTAIAICGGSYEVLSIPLHMSVKHLAISCVTMKPFRKGRLT